MEKVPYTLGMEPDRLKMVRARKVVDHGTGPHAIPLAQLTESILLNEKIDTLTETINSIELPEYPEIEIPEYPTEITVSNLPEVQKVELVNPPKDKDDKETQRLLKELVAEVKKKEQYTYDIEVDSNLKEQLRGERGEQGLSGSPDTPEDVRDKLSELEGEDRLDVSAIKGVDELVQSKVEGVKTSRGGLSRATADTLYTPLGAGLETTFETVSANLPSSNATLNYNVGGDITSIVYSNGVTKTFNYTGTDITSIVLSGSTPSGISLTKTLTYSSGDVTGIAYT